MITATLLRVPARVKRVVKRCGEEGRWRGVVRGGEGQREGVVRGVVMSSGVKGGSALV